MLSNVYSEIHKKYFDELEEEQQRLKGIDLRKLPIGTKLEVFTKNSVYTMEIISPKGEVKLMGGKRWPEFVYANIPGSTWGGTALKILWIGYGMHMEICVGDKTVTTTAVRAATITGPDYSFKMEWDNNE